jgi:hypothetical protein
MRATQRRTAPHHAGPFLCVVLGLTGLAASPACTDAIHLDPPAATSTSSTSSSSGGTGGAAAGSCRSSPDCALPTPVCDTVTQKCVECLTTLDCSLTPGPVCSAGKCECLVTGLSYCPGLNPACIDLLGSDNANCGKCGSACPSGCMMGKCDAGTGGSSGTGGHSGTGGSTGSTGTGGTGGV